MDTTGMKQIFSSLDSDLLGHITFYDRYMKDDLTVSRIIGETLACRDIVYKLPENKEKYSLFILGFVSAMRSDLAKAFYKEYFVFSCDYAIDNYEILYKKCKEKQFTSDQIIEAVKQSTLTILGRFLVEFRNEPKRTL